MVRQNHSTEFKPQSSTDRRMQAKWLRFLSEVGDNGPEPAADLKEDQSIQAALKLVGPVVCLLSKSAKSHSCRWRKCSAAWAINACLSALASMVVLASSQGSPISKVPGSWE